MRACFLLICRFLASAVGCALGFALGSKGTLDACTARSADIEDHTSRQMDVLMWQKQGIVVMMGALGLAVVGGAADEGEEGEGGGGGKGQGGSEAQDVVNKIATCVRAAATWASLYARNSVPCPHSMHVL